MKDEAEFKLSDPEYVGEFPLRQDITILPADDRKKYLLSWTIKEYSGSDIFKPYKGWISRFTKALEKKGYYGHLIDKHAIRDLKGIEVGDEVIVPCLIGMSDATITKVDYEAKTGEAQSEYCHFPLEFGGDDRGSWVCTMQINSSAIAKLSIDNTSTETEINNGEEK